uniref:Alpha-1,3-glucosyltransferase n=1 Tax=Elaeophora elaphi TaxID=1147741 RepID=A0A0R3RGQ1_9BILA
MMTTHLSAPEDRIKDSQSLDYLKRVKVEWFCYCCAAVFAIKFLLIPCYRSTDFEVHRNWMAITHALPICSWYYDDTSQWTLDYPPFFAFFEYFLSQIASKIIPSALVLQKHSYFSSELLYFQRFSVIATDVFYVLSCVFLTKSFFGHSKSDSNVEKNSVAAEVSLIANVSLLMIDNMHFQYNGILTSLLLVSLSWIMRNSFLFGAVTYCILLNMKHIYLYYAPAYAVYYAVNYLFPSGRAFIANGAKLVIVLILPFTLSFGPFINCDSDVLHQIRRRLFPFERGLTHAYWAPNLWACYNFADWYFYQVLKLTKWLPPNAHSPTYISGLVQEFKHSILPSVSPFGTSLVTLALLSPLVLLIRTQYSKNFPLLLTLSAFAFFLAGYHVHEKAVILITVPYTVLASSDHRFLPSFIVLSVVANVSLFPLFFTPFEDILKVFLYHQKRFHSIKNYAVSITLCYLFLSISIMRFLCPEKSLRFLQKLYLFGLLIVQVYCLVLHQVGDFHCAVLNIIFGTNFEFIPLMLTSLSTAFGICWIYIELLWIIFFKSPEHVGATCICERKLKRE